MSAGLTDLLQQVATEGSATTLASPGKALGATSINIASASGWPTATGFVFAIRTVDASGNELAGTYTEWIGTLSGTTISMGATPSPVVGSDQVYAAGATTQVYIPVSAVRENRLINALLEVFNQDMSFVSGLTLPSPNISSPALSGLLDGWIGAGESWTEASGTTITVPSNATTKYDVNDYIKLTQSSTVKYFKITAVSSTVLTVLGLNGETVANSPITANYYSKARNPHSIGVAGNTSRFLAVANDSGATLTTGFVTHATATATSHGGVVALRWGAQVANGNSGADRNFNVQILCDGSSTGINPGVLNFDSPYIAGATTNLFYGFTHSHTPAAGSHTWVLQFEASAGASIILSSNFLEIVEIV